MYALRWFCRQVASSGHPTPQELALFVCSFKLTAGSVQLIFMHAVCCYSKSVDSLMCSINISITSVRNYVSHMWKWWNFTVIKHMCKCVKPGPFSSSSLGLETKLTLTHIN